MAIVTRRQVSTTPRLMTGHRLATARTMVLLVGGALAVAGCSSGSSPSSSVAASPTSVTTIPVPPAVGLSTTKLGATLSDVAGRTLYIFDKDQVGSTTSACTGACASEWPALIVTATPTAGPGVSGTLAVIPASGGRTQVTWNGHPLYTFAGDHGPGDTNGNGIAGIWHAALNGASSGAPSPAVPAPTSPPTTASSGGYGY